VSSDLFFSSYASVITVFGPDLIRELLAHKKMIEIRKGRSYDISEPLIGDSVLRASNAAWAPQRAHIEKGMTHAILEQALPRVLQTVGELIHRWEATSLGRPVNIAEDMLKLTLDVLGRAAFSFDFNSTTALRTEDAPLYHPFALILSTLSARAQIPVYHLMRKLPLKQNLVLDAAIAKLDAQVDAVLQARLAKPRAENDPNVDLLDILLQGQGTDKAMPFGLVRDNIKTMLFAGHDTTGAALAWLLRLMAENPAYQQRLREEIVAHCGNDGDPTYAGLEDMAFLNACVLEVLRMYPSAGFTRVGVDDFSLGGYAVPGDVELLVLPYLAQRDERYWPRANEFVPDRFLHLGYDRSDSVGGGGGSGGEPARRDSEPATRDSRTDSAGVRADSLQSRIGRISAKHVFFPFSLGPRNCVGRPLALMEMRVVVVKLLQRFRFELCDDPEFKRTPLLELTLNPASIKLTVTPVN